MSFPGFSLTNIRNYVKNLMSTPGDVMAADRITASGKCMTSEIAAILQSIVMHGIKAGVAMQQSNGVLGITG